jgi:hypothetical protein
MSRRSVIVLMCHRHKLLGRNYSVAERLLASQEGLSSVELVLLIWIGFEPVPQEGGLKGKSTHGGVREQGAEENNWT